MVGGFTVVYPFVTFATRESPMPIQVRNQAPVRRPLGQVVPAPAAGGKVELRLHGVGGSAPEELLGDLAPRRVGGDRIAGFYRTADQPTPADDEDATSV